MVRFSKYCSPFKHPQEQLNGLCALNSPVPTPVLALPDIGTGSMQILPRHSQHCLKFPVKPRDSVQTSALPRGSFPRALSCTGADPSPTTDTDVLLMLNGNSWGWMRHGQMRDTKMSDSLPTVVAMRSNSQHQSDKLSDRMVQPWHGTTLTQQLQHSAPGPASPA